MIKDNNLYTENTKPIADKLFKNLFPIMRSITGPGFRESAKIGLEAFGISATEKKISSGSNVFDWKVPAEWDVQEAWVKNSEGKTIIDLKNSTLEVLNFSSAFEGIVGKEDLLDHLHTIPMRPEWIPYRTSYYEDNWGFCCKHSLITSSEFSEPFKVKIESTKKIKNGHLYWYEATHKGLTKDTIIISTYICHPSLANDNLSGFITALALFKNIMSKQTRFTYKLVIVPETIGALAFLQSCKKKNSIIGGLVVTTTAGRDPLGVKKTYLGNHWLDKIALKVCSEIDPKSFAYNFAPDGSDERQYSAPEFRIPTISITNSKYHEYDEYHTSADDLSYISIDNYCKNLEAHINVIDRLERNVIPKKINPKHKGEFQLGKRNLFPNIGGATYQKVSDVDSVNISQKHIDAYGWLMHLIDGKTSVLEMAEVSGIEFDLIYESLELFKSKGIIKF
jgi:hypothetical protein